MDRPRIHNTLFAILVGAVLGVTVWSLSQRTGGSISFDNPIADVVKEQPAAEAPVPIEKKKPSITDRMIERGELSKTPAKFWGKDKAPGQEVSQ